MYYVRALTEARKWGLVVECGAMSSASSALTSATHGKEAVYDFQGATV